MDIDQFNAEFGTDRKCLSYMMKLKYGGTSFNGRNVRLSLPPKGGGPSWCILHHVKNTDRPPLASLACTNHECPSYGRAGQGNLKQGRVRWTRKSYGPDRIRY